VQISDAQVDVPLFRQRWKLDSPMITRITDVVQSAASTLRKSRH
jgi:LysR family transcriptional regulator (chromosome initiation inhibitor)